MGRTKRPPYEEIIYVREEEPMSMSVILFDQFLKHENASDLIGLYLFYYRTAKYQKTNQPWVTTSFVAKGLQWTIEKVQKIKKQLLEMDLIEEISERTDGKFTKHFILVKFIWKASGGKSTQRFESVTGLNQSLVKMGTNALSDIKGNALSDIKEKNTLCRVENEEKIYPNKNSKEYRSKKYTSTANWLSEIINSKKTIKHTPPQLKSWANEIRRLVEENEVTPERIYSALEFYEKHIGEEYIPVIESGISLREKFSKLEAAMERNNQKQFKKFQKDYYESDEIPEHFKKQILKDQERNGKQFCQ